MSRIKSTFKVCIEPRFLGDRLNEAILTQLKQKYVNKCNKKFGYVSEIKPEIKILDNELSRLGGNVFYTVEGTLICIKPDIGTKFTGKVIHLYENGILVEIAQEMKVLIPTDKMNGFKYVKNQEIFKKKKEKISDGDEITVEITSVKYVDGNYSLIGKLF